MFGLRRRDREAIVTEMLRQHGTAVLTYWLKLMLAAALATLGVARGSAPLIFGAMLLSPLFSPTVSLAMGLVVRSPFLVLRSCVRVASSMVWSLAIAASMTMLLPIPEMTEEIASRTVTGYYDLLLAGLCAGVAALTVVRQQQQRLIAEVAIGLVLLPTLGVSGFGLGSGDLRVFSGAAWLFFTNLSTVLTVLFVVFSFLGFRANAARNETRKIVAVGNIARLAAFIRYLYDTRLGPLLRLLIRIVCLSIVGLGIGLGIWHADFQYRVQTSIRKQLAGKIVLKQQLRATRDRVEFHAVLMGSADLAQQTEDDLRAGLRALAPNLPFLRIQITGVPDDIQISEVETKFLGQSRLVDEPILPPVAETVAQSGGVAFEELQRRVGFHLVDTWPRTAGELVDWQLLQARDRPPALVLLHTGPPLGPLTEHLLIQVLQHPVRVVDRPLELGRWQLEGTNLMPWVMRVERALALAATTDKLFVCITTAAVPNLDPATTQLLEQLKGTPVANVAVTQAASWTVTTAVTNCNLDVSTQSSGTNVSPRTTE